MSVAELLGKARVAAVHADEQRAPTRRGSDGIFRDAGAQVPSPGSALEMAWLLAPPWRTRLLDGVLTGEYGPTVAPRELGGRTLATISVGVRRDPATMAAVLAGIDPREHSAAADRYINSSAGELLVRAAGAAAERRYLGREDEQLWRTAATDFVHLTADNRRRAWDAAVPWAEQHWHVIRVVAEQLAARGTLAAREVALVVAAVLAQ